MRKLDSMEQLQEYIDTIWVPLNHHQKQMRETASYLLFNVMHYGDTRSFEVWEREGQLGRLFFFKDRNTNRTFAIRWNKATQNLELREKSHLGDVLSVFTSESSFSEVRHAFRRALDSRRAA